MGVITHRLISCPSLRPPLHHRSFHRRSRHWNHRGGRRDWPPHRASLRKSKNY